jgi:beta-lactamase class A
MERTRGLSGIAAMTMAGALIAALLIPVLAQPAGAGASVRRAAVPTAICRSSSHSALAARISSDIQAARRGRVSSVAVAVDAPAVGLACSLNGSRHFDSASVVKVTILGALLHKALDQHRFLTNTETARLRAMITRSDNAAASALWAELGHGSLQRFLNLAGMTHTVLGPGGAWGLTQITGPDEILLLRLLLRPNAVLSPNSRDYALRLMAQVIPSQRWGVPVGAPTSLTAHVKNGWLPRATHGWRIHSIGCFTGHGGGYSIVVLTQDNPSMTYGITTVQAIARVINRDLTPGATARVPASRPFPSWGTPDEHIPARQDG